MRVTKRDELDRIYSAIRTGPANCHVLVSAEFARYFKKVPKDGRTYIVEDPNRTGVQHWTYPDGTYVRMERKVYPYKIPELNLTFFGKRVKGEVRKKAGKPRTAESLSATHATKTPSEALPTICLIDINRVMRICGFKKSFIYDQVNFPQPIRLGTSRRSAVRWVESEVIQWVQELAGKR